MNYEAWRIGYQSDEQAARAAFKAVCKLDERLRGIQSAQISMDVSTGVKDAGNRIFGRIVEIADGVILAEETERNYE